MPKNRNVVHPRTPAAVQAVPVPAPDRARNADLRSYREFVARKHELIRDELRAAASPKAQCGCTTAGMADDVKQPIHEDYGNRQSSPSEKTSAIDQHQDQHRQHHRLPIKRQALPPIVAPPQLLKESPDSDSVCSAGGGSRTGQTDEPPTEFYWVSPSSAGAVSRERPSVPPTTQLSAGEQR